jgi:hypothetical protein
MKTKTEKTRKADAPMTRNEFKDAISKMTRNELIGILCDIYYANTDAGDGGECACDCGCSDRSESKKTPAKAKKPVKSSRVSKKK